MSTRYGDRDDDRGQRESGRRSEWDEDRYSSEGSQRRYRYGRDEDERDRYSGESRWSGRSGSRSGSSQYGGSEYGGGRRGGGSQYGDTSSRYGRGGQYGGESSGGSQYGGSSRWRSRGREGYRPGSENDWDYADDRESRYGSFLRGYDTGSYDDTSRFDSSSRGSSQRYNYPSGYRSGESYGERGRGYDYDYGRDRSSEERGWLDRLADKLAAWFGDEDAERRYRTDEQRQRIRGKGPKSYRRSDERIREDVNERLSEGYLDASEIEVNVSEGLVTLTGTVNSRTDKRRAEDITEDVSGVKNVENRLRVQQSDIDRYPSLYGTSSRLDTSGTSGTSGTTGTTGTMGTTGATGTGTTGNADTSSSTGTAGTARGRTAGSQS